MFGSVLEGKKSPRQFFSDWISDVQANVPKEKLLLFECNQGWKPLCDFLNVPEPEMPFPKLNERTILQNKIKRMKMISYIIVYLVIPAAVFMGAFSIYKISILCL